MRAIDRLDGADWLGVDDVSGHEHDVGNGKGILAAGETESVDVVEAGTRRRIRNGEQVKKGGKKRGIGERADRGARGVVKLCQQRCEQRLIGAKSRCAATSARREQNAESGGQRRGDGQAERA